MNPSKRIKTESSAFSPTPLSSPPSNTRTLRRSSRSKRSESQDDEKENVRHSPRTPTSHTDKLASSDIHDEDEVADQPDDFSTATPNKSSPSMPGAMSYAAGGGAGYNALKSFNGQVYSGMAIGGSHTWNYDQGIWKETKEEPDLWKVEYETVKRRAKNAPQGSGAAVGTEYHWLIVAHQYVKKIDANSYETRLVGSKYKLAHKSGNSNSWSVPTVKAQREREVELLDDAKRRVQGLPPVLAGEKVKVEKREKGQQKLESLFAKKESNGTEKARGTKRKIDS